ncbi:zinc metalloprotease ProA [Legionella sp. CNM-4043-24]|uniref:zinc metalloprotease ProA n=1 Tax=Legionella sp. CNM-4043-24 TaxID=3421646 RepID=UPI00403A886A
MHPNFYLSPLAACLALTMASSAKAAEPVPLQKTSLESLKHSFQIALPGMKQASTATQPNTLKVLKQHTDSKKITHVRMQQQYRGFNVFGGYAISHGDTNAKSLLAGQNGQAQLSGAVYNGLENELGSPDADFVKNGQKALQQLKAKFNGKKLSQESVVPMVYVDDKNKAHWAYQVSVKVDQNGKIPERPTAIVDARTFDTFVQWNNIKTASPVVRVRGMGFGGNTKMGKITYGSNMTPLYLTRNSELSKCFMETADVKVVDMKHEEDSDNMAMSFDCELIPGLSRRTVWTGYNGDGYDENNGAYSPANDALYAGYVIKHMYSDWYDVDALTTEQGFPMQLVMRVHYGEDYGNAYWDGQQMTFGDGDYMMYPLVSLGVGAHEISHGFTEQNSDLMYYGQSGGMNESFSDMAAMAAEYYSTGTSSWMIGAEIMKEDSGYETLRYMDVPSRDGGSIDSADDYYIGLDVHYSSGVYNRLFYLISNLEGWNVRKAFDVMVKANMDYWTPYTRFQQGACGVLSAAKDLGYDAESLKPSMLTVGLRTQSCS